MATSDFQIQVLEKLSELTAHQAETTAEVRAIVQRLDRLNGSVGRHEQSIGELKLAEANRVGREQASGTWLKALAPAGWGFLGALVMIILQHANKVIPALK